MKAKFRFLQTQSSSDVSQTASQKLSRPADDEIAPAKSISESNCSTQARYNGLSRFDLKKAMLAALGELSNLRADSKSLRRKLESTRSALAEIHHRISLIQCELDKGTLIEFPQPVERLAQTTPSQVETVQRKKRA